MKAQALIDALRKDGERITVLRRAIVQCLVNASEPMTAVALIAVLKKMNLQPSPPSVYRELKFLTEKKMTRTLQFEERNRRYELVPADHRHHLICTECKGIEDVVVHHDLDVVEKNLEQQKKFKVKRHALEFYGVCNKCQ
jgi:Fe2+ or Zn2+ uptake regulation protein